MAVAEDGSFLVVWEGDAGLDGAFGSIRGRWFDMSASPQGGEFQINTYGAGDQRRPAVAAEPERHRAEVAVLTGSSVSAIDTHLARGLSKLRRTLGVESHA